MVELISCIKYDNCWRRSGLCETLSSWPTIWSASNLRRSNESLMPRLTRTVTFQRPVVYGVWTTFHVLPSAFVALSVSQVRIHIECVWRVLQPLRWSMQFVFIIIMRTSFSLRTGDIRECIVSISIFNISNEIYLWGRGFVSGIWSNVFSKCA